jgi:hypothetical protein
MEHEVSCQTNSIFYLFKIFFLKFYNKIIFIYLKKKKLIAEDTLSDEESKIKHNRLVNGVDFFCTICKQTLNLSAIDILKHKKSCFPK